MSGPDGSPVCTAFIEALGLKTLFSAFMGKVSWRALFDLDANLISPQSKKGKAGPVLPPSEDVGHVLGILASLFTHLESDSTDRLRLLAKFVENNYEKADKLMDIREAAVARLKGTDAAIEAEKRVSYTFTNEMLTPANSPTGTRR
jgi:beta-catenin-like protein 1